MADEEGTSRENAAGCEAVLAEEAANGESKKLLPADMYYNYEELRSRPYITPGSKIPENLLHFFHSFGYDSGRRANLQLLDKKTLIFIAGNLLVLVDISTKEQRYLRSCSGGGIGSITVHPSKEYFAAAEKGNHPNVIVYEYPSLRPYRILRGGTERAYSFVEFNCDGSLLASVGSAPDYMLTLWNWMQEEVMLSCKAVSQEVYRVSFSPYNPDLLTSSGSAHIKFWKIADTFTGLKLQGVMGSFGLTPTTDIEGFVELPGGKVVSGTYWGNLLLWDRSDINIEICRKDRQTCHVGKVQPFALEDGQLLTMGSDGVIRGWDFERIQSADGNSESSRFELEPLNEVVIGPNVCLSAMVKSSVFDSFIWFAQDSSGAIWKLDLSFTNTTLDPECLFSFHTGPIQGLDVSKKSYLMATTTLDRSVRIFDFLEKRELSTIRFNQGGTALSWVPEIVNETGCLLLIGFEDGVVRLLELYKPQRLQVVEGHTPKEDAKLRLKLAFKPHNTAVTAMAYEQKNGEILATGSTDCTVFFFTVREKYNPIGFIHVPGAVQALEWSPDSHPENRLLILCQNGYVVEVPRPDSKGEKPTKTFQLSDLPCRSFRFTSIKSQIKRQEEIARHQAIKEKKKKEREKHLKESKLPDLEEEEEEEEEEGKKLPPIYMPDSPSPLCCGFYSQPGQFWLSMGGYDAGYLYHCKFSEKQDEDPKKRQDEPFDFLPVYNADDDPICTITFSSNRQLLLCGMHSGSIRVYPLKPGDGSITSMQGYWSLSIHDNEYGHLQHIRCSYDDHFVLTAGDDGNIFSFSLLPLEELQKRLQREKAKVLSLRVSLESETLAQDIEDPAANSIEAAHQKLQNDRLRQKAELKQQEKLNKLAKLQKKYDPVLKINQSLPEHVCLKPKDLQLDPRFYEHIERMKVERVMHVRKVMACEQKSCNIAFNTLQDWFRDSPEANIVTVVAIHCDHRVSSYHLPVFTKLLIQQSTPNSLDEERNTLPEQIKSRAETAKDSSKTKEEEVLRPPEARPKVKLGNRWEERFQKAAARGEQARAKIEKRKQEWAKLYAEKPGADQEDPQDFQAICEAKEDIGNVKLKSAVAVPLTLRMTAERKREELSAMEKDVHRRQIEMNGCIVALRDSKVCLVSWFCDQARQLHLHLPTLPTILSEEIPEKWLQYKLNALARYCALKKQRYKVMEQEDVCWSSSEVESLLEQMKKELQEKEEKGVGEQEREEEKSPNLCSSSQTIQEEEIAVGEAAGLSELEEELQQEEEITLLYEQDSLLKKMESSVNEFDMEHLLLCQQKACQDIQRKLADLHQLTLCKEMMLLKQSESNDGSLWEKFNGYIKEEKNIRSKLQEFKEVLEVKQREIAKLQEKEKALFAAFVASLGEDNQFEEFLTKVFKKKIKHVKKNTESEEEEEGDGSEEDSDEDDDYSSTDEGGAPLDDSVCPPGCDPELFEFTLNLREHRLDLDERLSEEKKSAEALKTECDILIKKEKLVKNNRKAAENDLEQVNKEILQKMIELDAVIPLKLRQFQFVTKDSVPSDLSEVLFLHSTQPKLLQEGIKQVRMEKKHQKTQKSQAKKEHALLTQDLQDITADAKALEAHCKKLMMIKFGGLAHLDTQQSSSRRLEELKQEKLLKEVAYPNEIKQFDPKVDEETDRLHAVTELNAELLRSMTGLMEEKSMLEHKLGARQRKLGKQQYEDHSRCEKQEDIWRLEEMMKTQLQQETILKSSTELLSHKGAPSLSVGHALRNQSMTRPMFSTNRPHQPTRASAQTPSDAQSQHTLWVLTGSTLRAWYGFTPVFVVWSVYQLEALLHPSVLLVHVCWRLLFVCLLWITLAGCIHALKCCLQPGQSQLKGEPPEIEQEIVTEIRNHQYSWMLPSRNPGVNGNLVLALADSLLLCVLQEPLPDRSVPHIQVLSRLESVSQRLEKADVGSEVILEEVNQSSKVTDKLKLLHNYLQQRIVSLHTLVQVQGKFEASVKNMLQGLGDLWAQLEELHTGVTLTKQESQGHRDLVSAQTDTQNLLSVLGHHRNKLKSCQVHLKDSTQLLQELTWSHTHISKNVNSSSESVWPELLLQSNIEQFDKVQESFISLEQQTSNFQAHLEGLEKDHAGPLTHADSVLPQASLCVHSKVSLEHRNSTSSSTSSSSMDTGRATETDNAFSLCQRSARQFSSTVGRLRKSGRKK